VKKEDEKICLKVRCWSTNYWVHRVR